MIISFNSIIFHSFQYRVNFFPLLSASMDLEVPIVFAPFYYVPFYNNEKWLRVFPPSSLQLSYLETMIAILKRKRPRTLTEEDSHIIPLPAS